MSLAQISCITYCRTDGIKEAAQRNDHTSAVAAGIAVVCIAAVLIVIGVFAVTRHPDRRQVITVLLRAKAECFVRLCHRLGVRPSVRPSVTLVSCNKTVQARITKSSPWTAPRSLVYRDKISCHWVQGFPSNEGVEEGYSP